LTRCGWSAREKGGGVEVIVYVQPRAKKSEFAGLHGGNLKLKVAAPPVDNAANTEVLRFFASLLGVARSRVRIIGGEKSREKIIRIEGISLSEFNRVLESDLRVSG
jgi:uncharacterized protein